MSMKQRIDKDVTICNVIHRFIYIRLMEGHVAGGATFHQGVLLNYLHQIPFKNDIQCQ